MKTKLDLIVIVSILFFICSSCGQSGQKKGDNIKKDTINAKGVDTITKTDTEESQYYVNTTNPADKILVFDKYVIQKSIATQLPADKFIYAFEYGDLNGDKLNDAIAIVGKDNSIGSYQCFLFIGDESDNFILKEKNDSIIKYPGQSGQVGIKITIDYPQFRINQDEGSNFRLGQTYSFKYESSDKEWYLKNYEEHNYSIIDGNYKEESKPKILTVKDFGKLAFRNVLEGVK